MSRTIEDRIVNMQFQNKQFEDAVAQSRQSIQLLEKDLKLLEGVQALKNIDVAVQSIDVSGIARGIETLNDRFSTLGIIGMTVTQNLTNAFTSGLLGAIHSVGEKITGLFSTIYTKGLNRAKNIEQSNFALQGLLSTQYKVQNAQGEWVADMDTVKSKMKDIGKVIDASVSGTAYGYDQAARVASTLAASYGTSAAGIAGIGSALKSIVGMAGQTGQDFDSVARVFTKVAASGKAMSMELNSVSAWGVGATSMIADYINADKALKKEMNDALRTRKNVRKQYQEITEADVYELASKGKIASDMFIDVFAPFFENAQKANDTLSGVTANIGAALGRLGVSFIEPIMMNEGPLVNFLKVVRQKIVDIKNVIEDLHIPQNFTDAVTNFLETVTDILNNFDVTKLELFQRIANTIHNIHDAINITTKDDSFNTFLERTGVNYDKAREIYEKYIKKTDWREAFSTIFNFGVGDISIRDLSDDELEYLDRTYRQIKYKNDRWKKEYQKGNLISPYTYIYTYDGQLMQINAVQAMKDFDQAMNNMDQNNQERLRQLYSNARSITNEETARSEDLNNVFSYNYLDSLYDGLSNIASAFENIKNIFNGLFSNVDGPVKIIWDLITGNNVENSYPIRTFINELAESFLNLTEKVKNFTENNETFKTVLTAIFNIFNFLNDVIKSVWKIFGNAFNSFKPLLERIWDFIGKIAETINDIFGNSDRNADVLTTIVNVLSKAIDILAKVLIWAWDAIVGFLSALAPDNIDSTIGKFITICMTIGEYIGTNFPIWFERAKPYLEWFGEKVLEIAGWLKDKLGEAFNFVSPYVDTFVGWLSEVTDGAVDLKQPIQQVTDILNDNQETLDAVSTAAEDVSEAFTGMTDVFGGATGATFLGAPAKAFSGLAAALIDTSENKEKLDEMMQDEAATAEKVLTPWEKIKTTVTTVIETIKRWTKDKLEDFGILGDLVSIWDSIVAFFKGIKEKVGEINTEKVFNIIEGILGLVTAVLAKLAALKMGTDITGAIKKLPDMFTSISGTIRTFSPFYADVMKADNATTRREAMADILKSLAAVILSIVAAVAVLLYAVDKLGAMPNDQLTQGMNAMRDIMLPIIGIMAMLLLFMAIFVGKDRNVTTVDSLPFVGKIKGIKSVIDAAKNGGLSKQSKTVTSQGNNTWKPIAALGGVLVAFAIAVGVVAIAVHALGSMDPNQLNQGIVAFYQIAGVVIILMVLLGAFAAILRGGQNSSSKEWDNAEGSTTIGNKGIGWIKGASKGKKNKFSDINDADWKVLAAMGVALALIAGSISVIMWTISLVANVPMKNLDKSLEVFREVVIAVGLLLVILGVFASLMTLFNRGSGKSIAGPLVAMAVILAIIMAGVAGIMQMLVEIALLPIAPEKMDQAVEMFIKVMGAVTWVVAVVAGFIAIIVGLTAVGSIFGSNGNKMANALGGVAGVIATLALLFVAIGASFILLAMGIGMISVAMKDLNPSQLHSIVAVIAIFTGLVAVVLGCVIALMAISTYVDVGGGFLAMLAIVAGMFIAIGAVFLSIGVMAKMISESGIDLNGLVTIISIVGVIIGGIMVCVAVILALCSTGIGEAALASLAIIAALFGALGLLFISIGVAAIGIGAGLTLITDALIKFINFFAEEMSEEKTGAVMSNLEKFLYGLGTVIFAGLLGVAAFLDVNKERVVEAIKKIVSFILEAIWASFVQTFESNLEGLTQIIELLDLWIKKNKFEIERIIMNLGEILYTVINTFMDNIMKLILGSNYDGGTDGLLGQLTNGIINWLYTFFLNEDAVGRTLLNDLFTVIGETAHQGILDFFQLIIDSQDVPTKALEAVDSVIVGITEALVIKGPEIIDHVKELIRVIWALVLYALGVTDAVPHSSMYGIAGGTTKGDPEGAMTDWGDDMSSGLANYDWLGAVGRFLSNLWNTMLNVAAGANNILPGSGGLLGLGKILADRIIQGMHEEGQGGSPWGATEQEGIWAVQGAEIGLRNRQANARLEQAARNVSTTVVQSMRSGIDLASSTSPIMSGFVSEFNKLKDRLGLFFSPLLEGIEAKITPYMDLSQIQEGFGSIQDMMNGNSEFDISAISDGNGLSSLGGDITVSDEAAETAEGFDLANMPDMSGMEELSPETILNFTQNNYSPESLSRIDIYRDTKNMLNNPSLQSIVQNTDAYRLINQIHSGGSGGRF